MVGCGSRALNLFGNVDPFRSATPDAPRYVCLNLVFSAIFSAAMIAYAIYAITTFSRRTPTRELSTQEVTEPNALTVFTVYFYGVATPGSSFVARWDYRNTNCAGIIQSLGWSANSSAILDAAMTFDSGTFAGLQGFQTAIPVCSPTGLTSILSLSLLAPSLVFRVSGYVGGYLFDKPVNVTKLLAYDASVPRPFYVLGGPAPLNANVLLNFEVLSDNTLASKSLLPDSTPPTVSSSLTTPLVDQFPGTSSTCSDANGCSASFFISSTYKKVTVAYTGTFLDVISQIGGFSGPVMLGCKLLVTVCDFVWYKTTHCRRKKQGDNDSEKSFSKVEPLSNPLEDVRFEEAVDDKLLHEQEGVVLMPELN